MLPTRTTYHVATTGAEYKRLHAFFRTEAAHPHAQADQLPEYTPFTLGFPSVYGLRDDQVIGIMGTQAHPKYGLIACPFHVVYDIKNHDPTAIRLSDCYEAILADGGIEDYLIILPSWKPSIRLFSDLKSGQLMASLPRRLELYRIPVGI